MSKQKKSKRTKRQQPRPKRKKVETKSNCFKSTLFVTARKKIIESLKDKDKWEACVQENINIIEGYFHTYDSVQLLGSIGLFLLDNLPNIEKYFYAQINGTEMNLDENAEVIAEYALNFGLAMPNDSHENPTDKIVYDLKERLRTLFFLYLYKDMPLVDNPLESLEWMIHLDTIAVRGDGYQIHVYEVFKEMFYPHSKFYLAEYGFSIEQLFDFFMVLEDRVICKIADQNSIYGAYKMHERWIKWEEKTYGKLDDMSSLESRDFSEGLFGDFFVANPDVPHTEDGMQFLMCQPDDYSMSEKIFWVYPQNETEENILQSLSMEFGSNSSFLEGKYRGNIMNGHSIFEKPFIKNGDRYYCFTPMIPHRNLFLIAEKLMKRNDVYYQKKFQQNTNPISRDVYIENKVKKVMESFLPDVKFYNSVHYTVHENNTVKKTELDVLGISDKANYIIEIKAHELSRKDRVGLKGAEEKFKASIAEACSQCCRAQEYICDMEDPIFGVGKETIHIDKSKPVYKIAVSFQHYSSLLGQMDKLVKSGLIEERYRDTWMVSLFDLMVVSDFLESEDEFLSYLDMHKLINTNHSVFFDELDVLSQFLNDDLSNKVKPNTPIRIIGGANNIDSEYSEDYYLPFSSVNI